MKATTEEDGWTFESELQLPSRTHDVPSYEFDPFGGDFFLEWSLLDTRLVAFRSRVGVLLTNWRGDDPVNAALVVFDGITELRAMASHRVNDLTAWIVGGTTVGNSEWGPTFRFLDVSVNGNEVVVTAQRIEIRLGYCEEMTSTPPDFSELSPQQVMEATPDWSSSFTPQFAAVLSA